MPPKKKAIKKSIAPKKRRVRVSAASSSDHVPQLEAVIVDGRRESLHVVIVGRAATVLNKIYLASCGSVVALALLLAGLTSYADTVTIKSTKTQGPLIDIGKALGGSNDAPTVIAEIIKIFFGLLGLIFVVLLMYGGFLWMTDNGDEKQVTNAKNVIKNSAIGLVITVLAFAISNFVISRLASSV